MTQVIVTLAVQALTQKSVRMQEIETVPAEMYPALGTVYMKQTTLKALGNPKTVKLTIEAGDK